jgi:AGCS family alanine or glycine:cation symporter
VEQLQAAVDPVSSLLWGSVLIYVLLGAGVYFSVRTRLVQVRLFGHLWAVVLGSRRGAEGGISSFQAFCVGLASRVGTGNIAGVAIALTVGGPGAIFWMWCVAVLGMATAFVEATLAQIFKVPMPDGTFRGGPAYYIQRGLNFRPGGVVFSLLLIFTFGIAFNGVQANTIADVLSGAHTVPTWLTGLILAVLAAPVLFGGLRGVARVAEILLPLMALAYILLGVAIIIMNLGNVPHALVLIVESAFGVAPVAGGIAGGLLTGVKRGLFSNEAGMGSAPNTAATATVGHPATQGLVQSLGVFVDTMIICTMTALIILVSGLYDPAQPNAIGGAALTQAAVTANFGDAGRWIMTVIVFAFAFSSVLGNYAYADANLTFLGASPRVFTVFRMVALLAVFGGSLAELPLVWALADVAMGLMTMVNIAAVVLLARWALGALADYEAGRAAGKPPLFVATGNHYLPGRLESDVWTGRTTGERSSPPSKGK